MEYLLIFLVGILIGWLVSWYGFTIRKDWETSKNLRSSYDKAMKEIAEKSKKAREDRRKSLSTSVRASIKIVFLGLIVIVIVVLVANLLEIL